MPDYQPLDLSPVSWLHSLQSRFYTPAQSTNPPGQRTIRTPDQHGKKQHLVDPFPGDFRGCVRAEPPTIISQLGQSTQANDHRPQRSQP